MLYTILGASGMHPEEKMPFKLAITLTTSSVLVTQGSTKNYMNR